MEEHDEYVEQRIEQNRERLNGKMLALYPYGSYAQKVEKILNAHGFTVTYHVDNYASKDGVITLDEFEQLYDVKNTMVVLSTTNQGLFRELLGGLFKKGISTLNIFMVNKNLVLSIEALEKIISYKEWNSLLDIGCGQGLQGHIFEDYGKTVTGLTLNIDKRYMGDCLSHIEYIDLMNYNPLHKFDIVWASHMLEHVADVQMYVSKMKDVVKRGGIIAITVPPRESKITLTHVHSFNAGRILRYLLCAGIDCREVEIKEYDYNLSIIVKNVQFIPQDYDVAGMLNQSGDFPKVSKVFDFLPKQIQIKTEWDNNKSFDGDITELNWSEVPKDCVL